jgi:integrase
MALERNTVAPFSPVIAGYRAQRTFADVREMQVDQVERAQETTQISGTIERCERSIIPDPSAALRLQRLIIAALETACRRVELLKLQRCDVDLERRKLRAENAKDANPGTS